MRTMISILKTFFSYVLSFFKKEGISNLPPLTKEQQKVVDEESKKYNELSAKWESNTKAFLEHAEACANRLGMNSTPVFFKAIETITGDVYFMFADTSQIPLIRDEHIQRAIGAALFGVGTDKLEELSLSMKNIVAEDDKDAAMDLVKNLLYGLNDGYYMEHLIQIGAATVIRHDENPFEFNKYIHQEKVKAIIKDCSLRAFFLHTGMFIKEMFIPTFSKEYLTGKHRDIQTYTEGVAMEMERIIKKLQNTKTTR
jgi:hypothetical protein